MVLKILKIQNERIIKMGSSMLHAISFQIVKELTGRMKSGPMGPGTPVIKAFRTLTSSGPMQNTEGIKKKGIKKDRKPQQECQ